MTINSISGDEPSLIHNTDIAANVEDANKFVRALNPSGKGELSFLLNDEIVLADDPDFIKQNHGTLRVCAGDSEKVFFLFGTARDTTRDYWNECILPPTAAIWKTGVSILCWTLDKPARADDPKIVALAAEFEMVSVDEEIPLPGTDGWELAHADPATLYSLDALAETYVPDEPEALSDIEALSAKYHGARFATPFDEAKYDGCTVWFAVGNSKKDQDWLPRQTPLVDLLRMLCENKVGKKDGRAVVYGQMERGQRLKKAIKASTAIPLDFDTGIKSAVLDAELAKLGILCIRYTSHSHWKTHTDISLTAIRKFAGFDTEVTSEIMQRYLRQEKHWEEWIVPTVEYVGEEHTAEGYVCRVTHDPMPKHRVIVFLREPFVMREESADLSEAIAKWGKVIEGFAGKLGFNFDPTSKEPSQPFYVGRHDKDRPHEVVVFGGDLFDWRSLNVGGDDLYESLNKEFGKKGKKSKTPQGDALGKWAHRCADGFQVEEFIEDNCPDRIRGRTASGVTIKCPNDAAHHNPDDPNDTACYAKNADGEIFRISCRHANCQGLTMLDMLGMMIEADGIDRAVIDDPKYDAIDRGPSPDKQAAELQVKIDALDKNNWTDEQLESVIEILLKAGLSRPKFEEAEKAISKKLEIRIGIVRNTVGKVRRKIGKDDPSPAKNTPGGKRIFKYEGEPDFEVAADFCKQAILEANARKKLPIISVFDGEPVELTFTPEKRAKFAEMTQGAFWAYLCSLVAFVKKTEDFEGNAGKVPEDVAKYVYERCKLWLPASPTILSTPVFLRDGTLLDKPGYHVDHARGLNHLLIYPADFKTPKIKEKPTLEDAKASVAYLKLEFMGDFPLLDQNENGKESRAPAEANAFAMLLTPAMRPMISEQTPLFYVAKPKSGTGASFYAEAVCLIHLGEAILGVDYCDNQVELGKRIQTQIMTGCPIVPFDDVGRMEGKFMHRLITAPKVGGRILGGMTSFEVPNNFTYIATGNNPITDDQMYRRTVWVRMNAKRSDPTNRKFRHSGADGEYGLTFKQFCTQYRGEIIGHVLTIIRFWIQNGKTPFTRKTNRNFPLWSQTVGGVLEAVGIEGFMDEKKRVQVSAQDLNDLAFMSAWSVKYGFDGETNPLVALEWAKATGSVILRGKFDEEKKVNLLDDLHRLTDQTFPLTPVGGKTADYEFKLVTGADGPAYSITLSIDPNKKAANPDKEAAE